MKTTDKNHASEVERDFQWQELYVLTEHWQSDLEFYKDDLRFLHHLIDKYFIWITKSENLEMVKEIVLQVESLQRRCEEMLVSIQDHRHQITLLEDNDDPLQLQLVVEKHELMEEALYTFVKEFRANRKEVFRITEYVVDSEELSGIIRS